MSRGLYTICEGTDKRQTLATIDELLAIETPEQLRTLIEKQPEGWLRITLARRQGEDPEVLDFSGFDAMGDWAHRQEPLHRLDAARPPVRRAS